MMQMGKERAERGEQRKREGGDGRSCRKKDKGKEKGKTEDRDMNKCGKKEWITKKEREEEKTVDQVETNRNKTKETHPSRLSIKLSLCYYPNL